MKSIPILLLTKNLLTNWCGLNCTIVNGKYIMQYFWIQIFVQHPEFQEELANIVEENKNSFSNTLEDCKIIFSKALDDNRISIMEENNEKFVEPLHSELLAVKAEKVQ